MRSDLQLAGGIAKPCQDQDLGHHRPGNLFPSSRLSLFQKIHQPHLPRQLEPEPGTAQRPLAFDRDALQIDFHPLRGDVAEQSALSNCCSAGCLLVNAQTPGRIHLPQVRHHALPGAPRRAITLDQSPVAVALAILVAIAAAQVHASILRITASLARGLVFTTKAFAHLTRHASRTRARIREVRKSPRSNLLEGVLKKSSNRTKLRKLGYRPEGPGPFPTLLATTAYRYDDKQLLAYLLFLWRETGPIEWYVEQSYAYVHADVRGTGFSEGEYEFFGPCEQHDLYDLPRRGASLGAGPAHPERRMTFAAGSSPSAHEA